MGKITKSSRRTETSQGSPAATGWRLGAEPHWEVAVSTWVPEPLRAAVCVSGRRCVSYLMACVRPSSRARVVSTYIKTAAGEHLDRGGRPCLRGGRGVPQMRVPGLPAVCAVCACAGAGPTCVLCAVVGAAVRSAQASYLVESVRPSVPWGWQRFLTTASGSTCVLSWATSLWAAAVTSGRWRGIRVHKQRNTY